MIDKIREVAEIVKTLNLTFDGKLNSETLVIVTEKIMPYFWMLQVKSFIVHAFWAIAVVATAYFIGKALLKMCKEG